MKIFVQTAHPVPIEDLIKQSLRTSRAPLCIEPWYSVPSYDGEVDDLEQKQLMVHPAPDCEYENTYNITVG